MLTANMNDKRDTLVKGLMPPRVRAGDRPKATTINQLIEYGGRRTIQENTLPFRSTVGSDDETKWVFGMINTTSTCIVYNPALQLGGSWYTASTTTLALTGTPCYVYAQWLRSDPYTLSVQQATTLPASTATHLKWILAHFTASSGVYSLVKRYHRGAIQLDLPLV
jgi:hypothetical protein